MKQFLARILCFFTQHKPRVFLKYGDFGPPASVRCLRCGKVMTPNVWSRKDQRNMRLRNLIAFIIVGIFAGYASGNAPPHPKPTSQPVTIHSNVELNHLSNTLAYKTIFLTGGDYDLSPKLLKACGSVLFCPADDKAVVFNISAKNADRWAFTVDQDCNDVEIRDIRFNLPQKTGGIVNSWGNIRLVRCTTNQGNIFWGHGGGDVLIDHCRCLTTAKKYLICNFDSRLRSLRVLGGTFVQGDEEAALRLMQVNDSQIIGATIIGNGYKQAAQDRPGGKSGEKYHEHFWKDCRITSVDAGNFKDRKDKNFPFGVLALSRWENCAIEHFATTAEGANPIGKAMGIDRIELVNCTIGGKKTTKTITR